MRQLVLSTMAGMALLGTGCVYGPEHLNAFYQQRDYFQGLIDKIETEHRLVSRDAGKRVGEAAALAEAQRQASEAARLESEWLATLTPEQRFQWMITMQQKGVQREWMQTEIHKTLLTPRPVTNINTSLTVQQGQAQVHGW